MHWHDDLFALLFTWFLAIGALGYGLSKLCFTSIRNAAAGVHGSHSLAQAPQIMF